MSSYKKVILSQVLHSLIAALLTVLYFVSQICVRILVLPVRSSADHAAGEIGWAWCRPASHADALRISSCVPPFVKQFTLEPLEILIIIKHKCEGIASITARIQIRYVLPLRHKSEPCI